jgi:Fe-S oxidoreductase/nitrate reductase gamma subunit
MPLGPVSFCTLPAPSLRAVVTPHRPLFWSISGAWAFYALAAVALAVFAVGLGRHVAGWRRGDRPADWRLTLADLRAVAVDGLAGRLIFRGDPAAGLMHGLVLWGFSGLVVATVLSGVDHYLVRFLQGRLYLVYSAAADLAGVMLLVGLLWATARRYAQRVERLERRLEDLLVLLWLLAACLSGFLVEAVRLAITEPAWAGWSFAGWLAAGPLVGTEPGSLLYPVSWWAHALLSLSLIAAIPYTKLFHAIAAPASLAVARQTSPLPATGGEPSPMGWSQRERVFLDGCTRCGRCVEVCPSTRAGEPFSPRALVVALRDRLRGESSLGDSDSVGPEDGAPAGKAPSFGSLSWYCTTCHACVEACPVCVSPPDAAVGLRRQIVERGTEVPAPLTHTLERLFKYDNPWEASKKKRGSWCKGLSVTDLGRKAKKGAPAVAPVDWLYFVGCTTAIDTRAQRIAHALVRLFDAAGVSFGTLGKKEPCCGDIARRVGEVGLFLEQADGCRSQLARLGIERLVTSSPHCMHTFRRDYARLPALERAAARADEGRDSDDSNGDQPPAAPRAIHYVELLDELLQQGKLRLPGTLDVAATFHDPCYLGRHGGILEAPRRVLAAIEGVSLREMAHHRRDSLCCGGGGGRMWQEELTSDVPMAELRIREAAQTGAELLVTACPLCLIMLEDARKTAGLEGTLEVVDLAELCVRALDGGTRGSHTDQEES